jgi:hypothetical protein
VQVGELAWLAPWPCRQDESRIVVREAQALAEGSGHDESGAYDVFVVGPPHGLRDRGPVRRVEMARDAVHLVESRAMQAAEDIEYALDHHLGPDADGAGAARRTRRREQLVELLSGRGCRVVWRRTGRIRSQ